MPPFVLAPGGRCEFRAVPEGLAVPFEEAEPLALGPFGFVPAGFEPEGFVPAGLGPAASSGF